MSSVRKLGFAGAPMTDALLKKLDAAFRPELFVNHYGSSEIYTVTIDQNAAAKPGSAGRAGINQMVQVVRLGARSVAEIAAPGEEGEIIALLAGDEAFDGYWRRPDVLTTRPSATAGTLPAIPDLRMPTATCSSPAGLTILIITGGAILSPVEIESCLSLHPAVAEVAVAGFPDERWGKMFAPSSSAAA